MDKARQLGVVNDTCEGNEGEVREQVYDGAEEDGGEGGKREEVGGCQGGQRGEDGHPVDTGHIIVVGVRVKPRVRHIGAEDRLHRRGEEEGEDEAGDILGVGQQGCENNEDAEVQRGQFEGRLRVAEAVEEAAQREAAEADEKEGKNGEG